MSEVFKIPCPNCKGSGKTGEEYIGHGMIDYYTHWTCFKCEGSGRIKVKEVKTQRQDDE